MKWMTVLLCCLATCWLAGAARAQVDFFTAPGAFAAALPPGSTLASEDFEDGDLGGADWIAVAEPLDATTDDAAFDPGDIPPGVAFFSTTTAQLVLAGPAYAEFGWSGFPSQVLHSERTDCDAIEAVFTGGVNAVSLLAFGESGSVGISLYGAGDVLLGSTTVTTSATGGFFGALSQQPILRLVVNAPNPADCGNFEAIDDLAFGTVDLVVPIPTLGGIAMAALALVLAAAAFALLRRR
jgi:hypothetical protein